MTEPLITSEASADRHQADVLRQIRAIGVEPASVGVYGVQGKPMRTRVILYTQADLDRVAALGAEWRLSLSRRSA